MTCNPVEHARALRIRLALYLVMLATLALSLYSGVAGLAQS